MGAGFPEIPPGSRSAGGFGKAWRNVLGTGLDSDMPFT